jgi:hypothetical protein
MGGIFPENEEKREARCQSASKLARNNGQMKNIDAGNEMGNASFWINNNLLF